MTQPAYSSWYGMNAPDPSKAPPVLGSQSNFSGGGAYPNNPNDPRNIIGVGAHGSTGKEDPNAAAAYQQAADLANAEQAYLGRQAPSINQVSTTGLEGARANQLGALQAQQAVMNGPSLAGMQSNQTMGAAQLAARGMGGQSPLAARAAMIGGNNQMTGVAGQAGNAVGQEYGNRLGQYGGAVNTLGQGDIASQQAAEQLAQAQRKLYLTQGQQNSQMAQGNEQNYYNLQNAYTQQAQAALAAKLGLNAAQGQQTTQDISAILATLGTAAGMAMSDRRVKNPYPKKLGR